MIIHDKSHTDHAITPDQWAYIVEQFKDRSEFFIETIELPPSHGHVMNGLYGPSCGDSAIPETEVYYAPRPPRAWNSRMVKMPARETRFVRVIAGPHEEPCACSEPRPIGAPFTIESCACDGSGVIKHACILYTAYGVSSKDMPAAPKEPGDLVAQLQALAEKEPTATYEQDSERLRGQLRESQAFWAVHALAPEAQ